MASFSNVPPASSSADSAGTPTEDVPQKLDLTSFGQNAIVQICYLAVFGALAYSRFVTKDILS